MTPVLLDTGIIYALFDRKDAWHARAKAVLTRPALEFVIPMTVLPEVAYLLETRFPESASSHLAEWVLQPHFTIEGLVPQDLRRITVLMATYTSLGFVDSSIVAIAERLFIDTVATTDRRHFAIVRPSHVEQFALVP